MWRSDKTKEKESGLLGAVNGGKINIWVKQREEMHYFSILVCADSFDAKFLSPR